MTVVHPTLSRSLLSSEGRTRSSGQTTRSPCCLPSDFRNRLTRIASGGSWGRSKGCSEKVQGDGFTGNHIRPEFNGLWLDRQGK